ncbi:putative pyridine nucleotide-disulfide oxidoreductase [Trichinella spiralis]|uniref:putative pyridine nucleotide-disulfide oxidoreductase n=1 Tax=Trichinella spiralis TaxID=6334 RepID=UPI0001EFDF03|nr:putative pyridine nucleotide-disulfide oxidoreductase [Trichinella spiralis]
MHKKSVVQGRLTKQLIENNAMFKTTVKKIICSRSSLYTYFRSDDRRVISSDLRSTFQKTSLNIDTNTHTHTVHCQLSRFDFDGITSKNKRFTEQHYCNETV